MLILLMYATSGSASSGRSEGRPNRRRSLQPAVVLLPSRPETSARFIFTRRRSSPCRRPSLCRRVESGAIKGEETWAGLRWWCGGGGHFGDTAPWRIVVVYFPLCDSALWSCITSCLKPREKRRFLRFLYSVNLFRFLFLLIFYFHSLCCPCICLTLPPYVGNKIPAGYFCVFKRFLKDFNSK